MNFFINYDTKIRTIFANFISNKRIENINKLNFCFFYVKVPAQSVGR